MAKTKNINWTDIYEVTGIIPGKIVYPTIGVIDLSRLDIPIETIDKLNAEGCPFITKKIINVSTPIIE